MLQFAGFERGENIGLRMENRGNGPSAAALGVCVLLRFRGAGTAPRLCCYGRVRLTGRGAKWGVTRTSAHVLEQAHLRLRGPKAFQFLEET